MWVHTKFQAQNYKYIPLLKIQKLRQNRFEFSKFGFGVCLVFGN